MAPSAPLAYWHNAGSVLTWTYSEVFGRTGLYLNLADAEAERDMLARLALETYRRGELKASQGALHRCRELRAAITEARAYRRQLANPDIYAWDRRAA
jgi:hypothetical protein